MIGKSSFPHPAYAKHVLKPAYRSASAYLFEPMLAANKAHVVMLCRQQIISVDNATAILEAIEQIEHAGIDGLVYKSGVEDLFFLVEGRIIEIAGAEFGGNLQLARSRNDLGHALARMALRPLALGAHSRLLRLRQTIQDLAQRHLNTIMPGYTHTQPAQPITFAHYLAGALSFLERDVGRIQQAYDVTNRSPLGAAAFTGTGFPIDRGLCADLLGFAGIIPSSQDAIGGSDHQTDIAAALTSLAVNLSRLTHDLLFRATRESRAIRIDDSFIQISSIMPQKRNPVVLEHLRARLSRLLGQAQTIVTQCHNIPYGDTQDIEDEMEATLFGAIETADDILELYETVFATLTLNEERLRSEAGKGFTTVTELADMLVREGKLPFRTAHHIVSSLVQQANAAGLESEDLTMEMLNEAVGKTVGKPLELPADMLERALDPENFILVRQTAGGVAPQPTSALLTEQLGQIEGDREWEKVERARLDAGRKRLSDAVRQLRQ